MGCVTMVQAPSTLIPEYIGSDFDAVLTVADNIEAVKQVAAELYKLQDIYTLANNNANHISQLVSRVDELQYELNQLKAQLNS